MAGADLDQLSAWATLVAAADCDMNKAAAFQKKRPETRIYQDWRDLLDREHRNIDCVNVSTPDHMHAPIAMSAMQLGLHVYVQKPMAHELYEVRRLSEMAARNNLVTQMGIQIHSASAYKTAVRLIEEGTIGKVKEVHSWCNKAWGDMDPVPTTTGAPPDGFNWDLWLGVCETRPFIPGYYHPGAWRKRVDFGTATLGDMACHILDPIFTALGLSAPLTVTSYGPPPNKTNWGVNSRIAYTFRGTERCATSTIPVTWYDGATPLPQPVLSLLEGDEAPGAGSILVGTEGVMLLPHISRPLLYPDAKFQTRKVQMVPGGDHYKEFIEACKGNGCTSAPFSFSGPLTEAVLAGTVAMRFPSQTLAFDAHHLRFDYKPANAFVRRKYRTGWNVKGL